jgi:hypothetical protein
MSISPFFHNHFFYFSKVWFALTSSPVFSRTDTVTDSETFYSSILELFGDTDEKEEVAELLIWWNRYEIFILLSAAPNLLVYPVNVLARYSPIIQRCNAPFQRIAHWQESRKNGRC